jgi:hemerythrin-like domain-containing protein
MAMNLIRSAKKQVRRITAHARSNGNGQMAHGGADILDTLKKEHEEVAAMLKELVETDNGPARKRLVKQIKAALVPHLRAEEKVLYKSVIGLRDRHAKQDGEEGIIEHRLADKMLAGLGKAQSATSPQFSAAAKVLKELIQHHVEEEEREIWKDVKANFSTEDRVAMNQRFEAEKQRVRV